MDTEPRTLTFGISRHHGGGALVEHALRFSTALGTAASRFLSLAIEDDYETLYVALRHTRVSLAWLPPLIYARAASEGLRLVAVPERGGELGYRSAILVPKDSPDALLSTLRGLRAAWVDPSSASGYVFPRLELTGAGVTFASESFHGAVQEAAQAVASGQRDFCACFVTVGAASNPGQLEQELRVNLGESAARLRVIHLTEVIPPDALVLAPGLSAPTAETLTSALLQLHKTPEGLRAVHELMHADRLVPAGEATQRMLASWIHAGRPAAVAAQVRRRSDQS